MPAGRMLCNYTEKGLKRTQIYTILNISLSSRQLMASGSGEITVDSAQLCQIHDRGARAVLPFSAAKHCLENITFA
jgi:hypothetical protein